MVTGTGRPCFGLWQSVWDLGLEVGGSVAGAGFGKASREMKFLGREALAVVDRGLRDSGGSFFSASVDLTTGRRLGPLHQGQCPLRILCHILLFW